MVQHIIPCFYQVLNARLSLQRKAQIYPRSASVRPGESINQALFLSSTGAPAADFSRAGLTAAAVIFFRLARRIPHQQPRARVPPKIKTASNIPNQSTLGFIRS
jgi:hypothetical protein